MDTALRQRVQVLLEDERPRSTGLRERVRRVLAEDRDEDEEEEDKEKKERRYKPPNRKDHPPHSSHSAPPLEAGQGDRGVLQMAGADFSSE